MDRLSAALMGRKRKVKSNAAVGVVLDTQLRTMRFQDRAADRQSQPQSIALGGEERRENALEIASGNSRPAVAHRDAQVPRISAHCLHSNYTFVLRTILHRVKRIEQQIEHDLLQLNAVTPDLWQIVSYMHVQAHAPHNHVTAHQRDDIAYYTSSVEARGFELAPFTSARMRRMISAARLLSLARSVSSSAMSARFSASALM